MIKWIVISLCCISPLFSLAQRQGDGGEPHANGVGTPHNYITFSTPDIEQLRKEDSLIETSSKGPWRFGFNNPTNLSLNNSGTWIEQEDGSQIWTVYLECLEAKTVNLTFENVSIPQGNELFVYSPDKQTILGAFTEEHTYKGVLGTELIKGSKAVIEYYVSPENSKENTHLTIAKVTHGYRTHEEFLEKAFGDAGSCNINVNCPEAINFQDERRSVVMLVSGGNGFCTGAVINNTLNDGKPYVLTANHCYSDPASWVFRFNWESPDCDNPASSPSYSSLSGAELKARRDSSDFCLVEIIGGLESGTIPSAISPYFAGWDNSGLSPNNAVCIHHPSGDIKKIAFEDDAVLPTQVAIGGTQSDSAGVWQINWDRNTTTEGGSSGAALFNEDGLIIGQLWGGAASCSNQEGNDFYGRLATSWQPAGSDSSNQLKYWLDPNSQGTIIVNGYDPNLGIATIDAALLGPIGMDSTSCGGTVQPKIYLNNLGQQTITEATIHYGYNGVLDETYNWTGSLEQNEWEQLTLNSSNLAGGTQEFQAIIQNLSVGEDEITGNDTVSKSFYVVNFPNDVALELNLDCYASETSWDILDPLGNVVYSSPAYANEDEGQENYSLCLDPECYTFILYDSYGDGMTGCGTGNGSFALVQGTDTIASLAPENADFGSEISFNICVAGVEELQENQLLVYPNPAKNHVIVEFPKQEKRAITIFDATGKKVYQKDAKHKQQKCDVSALESGVYTLRVSSESNVFVQQLIILR